jgi:hypothetical protein
MHTALQCARNFGHADETYEYQIYECSDVIRKKVPSLPTATKAGLEDIFISYEKTDDALFKSICREVMKRISNPHHGLPACYSV